jgi:hypothetical protein
MVASDRRSDERFDIVSSVAATGTPAFLSWANDWIERNQARNPVLCGINRNPGTYPCAQ